MKIKTLVVKGNLLIGTITDAAINPTMKEAYVFDSTGLGWYLSGDEFEVVEEKTEEKLTPAPTQFSVMNDHFNQDLSELTVKFK